MGDVVRVYPESKTGLIHWIEENFHDIEEYTATFKMKDGTSFTVYDAFTYFNALVMIEMGREAIQESSREGTFIPKET